MLDQNAKRKFSELKEKWIHLHIEHVCLIDTIAGADEETHEGVMFPYGQSELQCGERVHSATLDEKSQASIFSIYHIRYSNPSGNDPGVVMGNSPKQPAIFVSIVCEVLAGKRDQLGIIHYTRWYMLSHKGEVAQGPSCSF
ncbi:uncharacterized protein MELLADRAFT_102063 [Melampsora larici-populina 98AG31]|uniref:Uncharacterized protein n=1 Tax=Melampsora larici-populina (strain 98AG31 / pathotype 3-4-7) TaxID=747676 RepID=F4R5W2_MELLP|nr:uncharacterized protein MELLADRAFT_102063 [Melampsora larici-populina 98AG31]EGG12109.1 hypothetical protein MELLADRAFT_102063 [Melampsora larici-populina 98AG31]